MKKALRYALPVPVKKALKFSVYTLLDGVDLVLGRRDKHYPPRRLNFVGSADFKAVGDEFKNLFVDVGGLKPSDRVLDIGCGIGRMALPLTSVITSGGYEGFDIDKRGVDWCQQHITPRCPHFQFQYVDLYNKYYNPAATTLPKDFCFPYDDNTFDFAFATSVFTHLLPDDAAHYLTEIKRVLKPNGTAFLTWFLLDEARRKQMQTEASNANFAYNLKGANYCFYSHKHNPEAEIAYTQKWLKNQVGSYDFKAGSWDGTAGLSYQDVVLWRPKK